MPEFTQTDWYLFPLYYDIVYGKDARREVDFLEGVLARHGPLKSGARGRVLEPACGNGRLVVETARRGHHVTGFDLSAPMLAYAQNRRAKQPPKVQEQIALRPGRMESFRLPGSFHFAHCLASTFKYLLTEQHAVAHLRRIAAALVPGGIYLIALHLTNYRRRRNEREVWSGQRAGVRVRSEVVTEQPDRDTRREWLRSRLHVRRQGIRTVERLESRWQFRTYDATELEALLARVPVLEPVACYDFSFQLDHLRALDDTQEDMVIVLRRR